MNAEYALREALIQQGESEFVPKPGIVPGSEIFERHSHIFCNYINALRTSNGKSVISRFLYIDRPDFNASAFEWNGFHYASMNWGTVILLYDWFFRILASPVTFADIGNASEEIQIPKYDKLPISARGLPTSATNPFGLNITPRCRVRYAYALYLVQIALDFLFIHEHQHVAGGHLSIIGSGDARLVNEIESADWIGELLTRHVLELEADAAAASFSLGITCDRVGNHWRIPPNADKCLDTEESRAHAWMSSIFVVFLVIEECANRSKSTVTHPSAIFRMWLVLSVFGYRRNLFDTPGKLVGIALKSMREADIAMDTIARRLGQKKFIIEHVSTSALDHKIILMNKWRELLPQLDFLAKKQGAFCAPEPLIRFFAEA